MSLRQFFKHYRKYNGGQIPLDVINKERVRKGKQPFSLSSMVTAAKSAPRTDPDFDLPDFLVNYELHDEDF